MVQRTRNGQENWKGIVWVFLLVILSSFTSAVVVITDIQAPSTAFENGLVQVSFTAEDSEGGDIDYEILLDGSQVATTNQYDWQTDYSSSGNRVFTFIASTANSSDSETRTVVVEDDPMDITILSPQESSYQDNSITITVTTDRGTTCTYELNNSETGTLTYDGNQFSKSTTLSVGVYELEVTCSNVEELNSKTMEFEIDQTPPVIIIAEPSNPYSNPIQGSVATLHVETSEEGSCKYDVSDNSYDSLEYSFSNSGSENHYAELTGLGEGKHIYYVRCQDSAGNKMTSSEVISFYTNKKPSAEVSIDGSSPFNAGRYDVTLTTSEEMLTEPELRYNFHNDGNMKAVSLTGSGRTWTGYMIIDESTADSIGTFYFSGTDILGLAGSEITEGKLFIVDTTAPAVVDSFEIVQEGDDLELEWHYDGEEVKKFNVYRSMSSGVSLVDFYAETTNTFFKDNDAEEGVTYYYKITAEDDAENEGVLSEQKSGMVEPTLVEAKTLSATLSARVDQKIGAVESAIIDIDWSIRNLEEEKDNDRMEVISKLSLLEKLRSLKTSIESLKRDLEKMKNIDLSEDDFNKQIGRIETSLSDYESQIIKSVNVVDEIGYEQTFDQNVFMEELNQYASYKNLENNEEFVELNQELQEKITITSKIMVAKVEYIDNGDSSDYTVVTKTITSSESLSDISIVENIPKIVEDDTDNIKFSTNPIILKKDPLVEWVHASMSSNTFYYVVFDAVEISEAKKTVTSVFARVKEEVVAEPEELTDNEITGLVLEDDSSSSGFTLIFIIIGSVVIAGLLLYYFFFIENESSEMVEAPKIVKKSLPKQAVQKVQGVSFTGSMAELIMNANRKADEMDFGRVYKLYMSIMHLYSASTFNGKQEQILAAAEINKIYSKILIFSRIRQANSSMSANNAENLKIVLDEISRLLKLHENDSSVFYNRMKILHNHLSVTSIGLGGFLR